MRKIYQISFTGQVVVTIFSNLSLDVTVQPVVHYMGVCLSITKRSEILLQSIAVNAD